MGLISASSSCASCLDLLLVSCYFDSVLLHSVSTELSSNALLVSTFSYVVRIFLSFTQLSYSLFSCTLSSMDFLTDFKYWISMSRNPGIACPGEPSIKFLLPSIHSSWLVFATVIKLILIENKELCSSNHCGLKDSIRSQKDVEFVKQLVNWSMPALGREGVGEGWKGFVYALEGVYDKDIALEKIRSLKGHDDGNSLSNMLWWIHSRDDGDHQGYEGGYKHSVPSLLAYSEISSSDSGMALFRCTSSSKTSSSKSKDTGVSLILRIVNTFPLVENANSEATEKLEHLLNPWPCGIERETLFHFLSKNLRHQKLQTLWDEDV
nr:probable endo-1,3(4)-beta-glucanase [Tanacetum cinerariifolium]